MPSRARLLLSLYLCSLSCTSETTSPLPSVEVIGGEQAPLLDPSKRRDAGLDELDEGVAGSSSVSVDQGTLDASPPPLDLSARDAEVTDEGLIDAEVSDLGVVVDMAPAPVACGCYAGEGLYCASLVRAYAIDTGCVPPPLSDGDRLWACSLTEGGQGAWSERELCAHGCEAGELASADRCGLPPCECFVRVSWCGASAGRHGEENLDCQVPLLPERDNDLLGCRDGEWVVLESCEYGCLEQATGTPDDCRLFPDLGEERWPDCPSAPLLHAGLHPEASDRLRCAGVSASRITQTIGSAPASAGYHAADGSANGLDYCAAVDLRTRDLSTAQVRELLDQLGRNGFAAWYRQPGADGWPSSQAPHIHAVFAGVRMKSQLRGQVRDFLENRNGLSSHTVYQFWDIPVEIKTLVAELFGRHYTP